MTMLTDKQAAVTSAEAGSRARLNRNRVLVLAFIVVLVLLPALAGMAGRQQEAWRGGRMRDAVAVGN